MYLTLDFNLHRCAVVTFEPLDSLPYPEEFQMVPKLTECAIVYRQ